MFAATHLDVFRQLPLQRAVVAFALWRLRYKLCKVEEDVKRTSRVQRLINEKMEAIEYRNVERKGNNKKERERRRRRNKKKNKQKGKKKYKSKSQGRKKRNTKTNKNQRRKRKKRRRGEGETQISFITGLIIDMISIFPRVVSADPLLLNFVIQSFVPCTVPLTSLFFVAILPHVAALLRL